MELAQDEQGQPGNKQGKSVVDKIRSYLKDNKACFILAAILFITICCWVGHACMLKQGYSRQEQELIHSYRMKIDSLSATNKKMVSEAFAWAVRSEMIRRNVDQVDQYFLTFIRQPQVLKISYMDSDSGRTLVSTDKKDEGAVAGPSLMASDSTFIHTGDSVMRVETPVMGLNKRLGTLVIDYSK